MDSRQSKIIIRPIINEKTVGQAENLKQYTFEVVKDANKTEIAQALKKILNELYPKSTTKLFSEKSDSPATWTIVSVNTAPIRVRFRRNKRHGRFPIDGKKAIVTIQGEPLELFSA
jgi:ribosomal protein L23